MSNNITMASEDICRIIDLCGKSGVSVLKYGPLEISFGSHPTARTTPYPEIENSAEKALLIHTDTISKEEVETKDDLLSRLQVEDPVALERLIMSGDIEDAE